MTEELKIREALIEAAEFFDKIKAAVFTTFNFQSDFFENNVLPALFSVEAVHETSRRVSVNEQLSNTQVSVLYDASTKPKGGGIYRYQQHGIFVSPRFFHPKLIFIAGEDSVEGKLWLYLSVSSANLTLSGWGKNQEVFGELWIGSNRQTLHSEVKSALEWLKKKLRATKIPSPAVDLCLQVMDDMGGSTQADFTKNASFYFSPLHKEGFWPALKKGQVQKWDRLFALSPYWGSVDDNLNNANAREYELMPALLDNGKYGIGRQSIENRKDVTLFHLSKRDDIRLWHAKAYFLERRDRVRIGIGSVNFTEAGLSGGSKGNIEAMIIYEADVCLQKVKIPDRVRLKLDDERFQEEDSDESPEVAPVFIIVVYDWREREYRVIFKPENTPGSSDYQLSLPGFNSYVLENKPSEISIPYSKGPLKETTFKVVWQRNNEPNAFSGLINEINLEHSDKRYMRPLALSEILDSWRSPSRKPRPQEGDGDEDDDDDNDNGNGGSGKAQDELDAGFDVLNLYEMYRAFILKRKKIEEAIENEDFELVTSYLIKQSDCVYRLAKMAGIQTEDQTVESPIKRYLVLMECRDIIKEYRNKLPSPKFDIKFLRDVEYWLAELQLAVAKLCSDKSPKHGDVEVFNWLEKELVKVWRA